MTDLEGLQAYHAGDERPDTTTPRVESLREAAKITEAIHYDIMAKHAAARQREADTYVDTDLRDALDRIAALETEVEQLRHALWALQDWQREQEAGK